MKLRLVAAIAVLVATAALAHAQPGGPPPSVPKPTKADVQKVVQIITSDKAKTQAYCDLNKLYGQMDAAEQKNDSRTAQALDKQADALVGKLGPEYSKVMGGLVQIDPNSSEGKEFMSMLLGLHKLCSGPSLAQPAQPAPAQAQTAPAQPAPAQPAPAQAQTAPAQPAPAQTAPAQAQTAPAQPAPAQPAPNRVGPCALITAACKQAGFVPNGAKTGVGIVVDCVRPIMVGTPQQVQGAKPLPQVDPQVVAACKQRNPNFGMGGGAQPSGQPATKPSGT
jgi:hypothetical protein